MIQQSSLEDRNLTLHRVMLHLHIPGQGVSILKGIAFCSSAPCISTDIVQRLGVKGDQFDACLGQQVQSIVGDVGHLHSMI